MAEFADLGVGHQSEPSTTASPVEENALNLTVPGSVLSGVSAGVQQVGSPSLTIDSNQNLITVKPISTSGTKILRFGQVAQGFLGMAVNNGTVDTMFAGQDSNGNTVVKIAKPSFDAKTATNDQLAFNSAQDVLKVVSTVNLSVTVGGSGSYSSSSTPHGLSFTPAILPYITNPAGIAGDNPVINHGNPSMIYGTVGGVFRIFGLGEVTVDGTNVYLSAQTDGSVGAGSYTFTAKVYLLQETFS